MGNSLFESEPFITDTIKALEKDGYALVENVIDLNLVDALCLDLQDATIQCSEIQKRHEVGKSGDKTESKYGGDGALGGAAHHVVCFEGAFFELLAQRPLFAVVERYLGGKFILNSFGGFTNLNSEGAYQHGGLVHRDTRSFHPTYRQALWMFVMLDDFTRENGATWVLAGSQNQEFPPPDEEFFNSAKQVEGKAGSVILLDGRVWHAAGKNRIERPRRILTISYTLPYVKSQMDYIRYFGADKVKEMSPNFQQLFGFHARIPSSFDEWYLRPEERFYKSNQG